MADVAITTTIVDRGKLIGGIRCVLADLTIGSGTTYNSTTKIGTAAGVNAAGFQIRTLENLVFLDAAWGGYVPWWDRTNKRISLFRTAGAAVLSVTSAEAVTVTTDVGTLAAPPAVILAIHGTVGATSTNFKVVAAARTLATGEVHVNYTTGAITFYASDDPTSVTVDYVPKTSAGSPAALAEVANAVNISTAISTTALRVMALGV